MSLDVSICYQEWTNMWPKIEQSVVIVMLYQEKKYVVIYSKKQQKNIPEKWTKSRLFNKELRDIWEW